MDFPSEEDSFSIKKNMQLQHFDPSWKNLYSPKYWYDLFWSRYELSDFPKNHFDYIDTTTYIACTEQEMKDMNTIVRSVNGIFRKWYDFYFENLDTNLPDFIGYHPYFRKDFPYEEYFIGRYDILIDASGTLKFLETNANTPGMQFESHHPAQILTPPGYTNQSANLIQYIENWWRTRRDTHNWKTIAIFTAYTHENEDYIICRNYMDILISVYGEENIIIGDIYDMNIIDDSYITMKWVPVDSILSYFPLEFFLTDIDFASKFLRVLDLGNCFLANPIESMLPQDKLMFAVVWEHIDDYTENEQAIIRKHIPYTTRVFQENSDRFLAKWRFGRYGREIYTERFYSNIDDDHRYIYQEKIIPRKEDSLGSYLVLSAYTDFTDSISWISRKQENRTTDDTYNMVTLLYTSPS